MSGDEAVQALLGLTTAALGYIVKRRDKDLDALRQEVADVRKRVGELEASQAATEATLDGLDQRLDRIEGGVDTLVADVKELLKRPAAGPAA